MKIALCDDNVAVIDFLEEKISAEFGNRFELIRYDDILRLWHDFNIPNKRADIIIMDIHFPNENGVTITQQIQSLYSDVKVIFITGYPELASQIFRASPTFLLMKPISEELLLEAVASAEKQLQIENDKAIWLSFNGSALRLKPSSIYYIELKNRSASVYWTGGNFVTKRSLDELESMLPSENFNRIHKSFLVNMDYIIEYNYTQLTLANSKTLPISRAKAKHAREKFLAYLNCH